MISARTLVTSLFVAGSLGIVAWERMALHQARQEQRSLEANQQESERLLAENAELSSQREATATRAVASPELLRLRNVVSQLRSVAPEVDRLRADNARLAALPAPASTGQTLSELEGYVAREYWSDGGFVSPDATVQTWFRAVRDQDTPRLVSCLSVQGGLALGVRTNSTNGELRLDSQQAARDLGQINGFRIEERNETGEGQMTLGIRAAAGGHIVRILLRRVGTDWKIDGFF